MQPDELKAIRTRLKLSQQALADALDVSRVLVNQMEAGKAPIEKRTAMAVRYLDIMLRLDGPALNVEDLTEL